MKHSESFLQGVKACGPAIPTLFFIALGFGVASQAQNIRPVTAGVMTLALLSMPAQYAMLDIYSGGGAALQLVIVGILINLRFFVMSLWLAQTFRGRALAKIVPWTHFVAMTPYLLTFFQHRKDGSTDSFDFFRGVVTAMAPGIITGTLVGIWLGGGISSSLIFGASLFMPIYFALLLASDVKQKHEIAAVGLGFTLTPVFEVLASGWGLTIAALITGFIMTSMEP